MSVRFYVDDGGVGFHFAPSVSLQKAQDEFGTVFNMGLQYWWHALEVVDDVTKSAVFAASRSQRSVAYSADLEKTMR